VVNCDFSRLKVEIMLRNETTIISCYRRLFRSVLSENVFSAGLLMGMLSLFTFKAPIAVDRQIEREMSLRSASLEKK